MTGARWTSLLVVLILAAPLTIMGCTGDDGDDGATGATGATGSPGADGDDGLDTTTAISLEIDEPEELNVDVTGITIASPPVVTFRLTDEFGRVALGLGSNTYSRGLRWIRFVMAKLVEGEDGDADQWVRYTYEREPAGLVDHGDGTYTYTFEMDLGDYDSEVAYEPNLTHRLAIQSSSGSWEPINYVMDFVPGQLPATNFVLPATRDIVTTDACNECHGDLRVHGTRYEVKYCVTCHNPGLGEADMTYMVHAIHASDVREEAYILDGEDFSEIGYPQDQQNCTKCHNGPDGDNWKTRPTMWGCAGCHDEVDFSGDGDHLAQASNAACSLCHTPDWMEETHLTENATEHNPDLPEDLIDIKYEIDSVTVDGDGVPTVKFRVLGDGVPLVFNTYDEGDEIMVPGFTDRAPGFLMAWASPQDDIQEPADYNNLGNEAGQPTRVDLDEIWNGSEGTLSGPDGNGWYMAEITAGAYPEGATLRAVALQGYFQQLVDEGTEDEDDVGRHAISVIDWADGEARREIVDDAKCSSCHEWFEGHGGNRVYTIQVCAVCHVPNLSSSGRTLNLTGHVPGADDDLIPGRTSSFNSSTDATVAALGSDPLTYPEDTNSLKDMVHAIHGSHDRENAFRFVRVRGGNGYYYDLSHVTYPTDSNKCLTCHKEGTYMPEMVPAAALWSNTKTTSGDENEDRGAIETARENVPNPTDLVNSPISASCYGCHDSTAAVKHMEQNGGFIRMVRQDALDWKPFETCIVCHGDGKIADVELVHEED